MCDNVAWLVASKAKQRTELSGCTRRQSSPSTCCMKMTAVHQQAYSADINFYCEEDAHVYPKLDITLHDKN